MTLNTANKIFFAALWVGIIVGTVVRVITFPVRLASAMWHWIKAPVLTARKLTHSSK